MFSVKRAWSNIFSVFDKEFKNEHLRDIFEIRNCNFLANKIKKGAAENATRRKINETSKMLFDIEV